MTPIISMFEGFSSENDSGQQDFEKSLADSDKVDLFSLGGGSNSDLFSLGGGSYADLFSSDAGINANPLSK